MKNCRHYTDEDFQNYLDNTFTGNISSLENHIQECELCSKNLEAYSLVWSFSKSNLQTKPLGIDLAYSVTNKVFSVKENKHVFEKVMYGILICLVIVCLALCLRFLLSSSIPVSFILLTIPVGLFLWVNYKEIKIVQKKIALYS
jgi:hypothetical protein